MTSQSVYLKETMLRPNGELNALTGNESGVQEKKPKQKRFKKIRSLFLHPFHASSSGGDNTPHQRQAGPAAAGMQINKAPPEGIGRGIGALGGITNHGNTCYINSVLQCLSHTDQFAEKLIVDSFGVTPAQPSCGAVTDEVTLLMALLWAKLDFPQVSLDFYRFISRIAPQYYGNNQHDAQEFLLWLLDKLYEEFNTTAPPRHVATTTNMTNFIKELFWAQLKSTVKCPNCRYESVTLEPYVCISLPVPVQDVKAVFVSVVYRNSIRNRKFGVLLGRMHSVKQLRVAISGLSGLHDDQILIADLLDTELGRVFYDDQSVTIVSGRHLYALEIPTRQTAVDHRTGREVLLIYAVNRCGSLLDGKWFGVPMIFRIHRDLTHYQFQSVLLKALGDHVLTHVNVFKVWHDLLFCCRLLDPVSAKCVHLTNLHRPFYSTAVERSLHECLQRGISPHLKLVLEWEQSVVLNIFGTLLGTTIMEDNSVSQTCSYMLQSEMTSLDNCLQQYTEQELLSKDGLWTCSNCQQPQIGAAKKISLCNVPEILVLHLKRFKQDGTVRAKLQSLVKFPIKGLDMNPYLEKRLLSKSCSSLPRDGYSSQAMLSRAASQLLPHQGPAKKVPSKKTFGNTLIRKLYRSPNSATLRPVASAPLVDSSNNIYDLYAVCNHIGTMNSGHYTAFCRNQRDSQWYLYGDTQVTPISESEVVTKAAYMLFYSRRRQHDYRTHHWSYGIAKHVLYAAVASRSHVGHLLGGSHLPAKKRLDSTSSLPVGSVSTTSRKTSDSVMSVPPTVMSTGRSNRFNPHLNTVKEVTTNVLGCVPHQATRTSAESVTNVTSPHQKSFSFDQTAAATAATEYHRRSKSFDSSKHPGDRLSPARSDVVKQKVHDWSHQSQTLPHKHHSKGISSTLHLPQSGTETFV